MSTLGRVAAILRVSFDAARAGDCSRQPQSASRPALVGLEAVVGAADIDARASDCFAWGLGVQPHVTTMTFTLRGVPQVVAPHAIDDVTWLGTFTVDAGSLTLLTLFTP